MTNECFKLTILKMVGIAQLVEYQIVALMVIGSSPIIYPMWFLFFNQKKNNFNQNFLSINKMFTVREISKKYKSVDNTKFITNITKFIKIFYITNALILKNNFFINKNHNFADFTNYFLYVNLLNKFKLNSLLSKPKLILTLIISFKTQLRVSFLKNQQLIKNSTNGLFLKKLDLEKCQKKNDKVLIINLKDMSSFVNNYFEMNKMKLLFINVNNTSSKLLKIINFIKKNVVNHNYIIFYTPKINYSHTKFKKIKSIKRKLTKKYNHILKG